LIRLSTLRKNGPGGTLYFVVNPHSLHFVILHYHLRPGGVRRVIERALPALLAGAPTDKIRVTLLTGETPAHSSWIKSLRQACVPCPIEIVAEKALGYVSDSPELSPAMRRDRIRNTLNQLLQTSPDESISLWTHNLGLARNVALAREIANFSKKHEIPTLSLHHDFWFDNRWERWREARANGCRSESQLARALFPSQPGFHHATINRSDHQNMRRLASSSVIWLPNSCAPPYPAAKSKIRPARRWMDSITGGKFQRFWILPCRLLRRKNVAEALLLMHWFDPAAALITTGGVSSPAEAGYADQLRESAARGKWPLFLAALETSSGPGIDDVMAAADLLVLTSLQEGFGLAYLEAAASGRPLVCRRLPNVAPDLASMGFTFPLSYSEVRVSTGLFDLKAELKRQKAKWARWLRNLPSGYRREAGKPELLLDPARPSVAFSRLTLSAQLEVLAHPPEVSRQESRRFNRGLEDRLRELSSAPATVWPDEATRFLSAARYAQRFWDCLSHQTGAAFDARGLQRQFIKKKLTSSNLYPLLFESDCL